MIDFRVYRKILIPKTPADASLFAVCGITTSHINEN